MRREQDEASHADSSKTDQTATSERPPPAKRRKKERGQNKRRPRAAKVNHSDMLCPSLYHGSSSTANRPCQFGEKCRYSHNCAEFLVNKPPDIGETCYLFATLGRCPYGLACRYGNSHMTSDQQNVINDDLFDPDRAKTMRNIVSRSLQQKLRKREVDLPKSEHFLREFGKVKNGSDGGEWRSKREDEEGGEGGSGRGDEEKEGDGEEREGEGEEKEREGGMKKGEEEGDGEKGEREGDGNEDKHGKTTEGEEIKDGGEVVIKSHHQCVLSPEVQRKEGCRETVQTDNHIVQDKDTRAMKFNDDQSRAIERPAAVAGAVTDEDLIRLQPAEKKKVILLSNIQCMYTVH